MAIRDMVMGGGACVIPDPSGASSSSNPLGGFANSLLGSASKTQERIRELPGLAGPRQQADFTGETLTSLPGSEFGTEELLRGPDEADQWGFSDAWGAATNVPDPMGALGRIGGPLQHEPMPGSQQRPVNLDGSPQSMLSGFLQSFVTSSRTEGPFHAVPLPELGLSQADKRRIRDRSSIMSRHFFAERGDEFVNAQVSALLQSLNIENDLMVRQPMDGQRLELERYWDESQMPFVRGPGVPNQWAQEFHQQHGATLRPGLWAQDFHLQYGRASEPGQSWANEFHTQKNVDQWVDQFGQHRQQLETKGLYRNGDASTTVALEETQNLVQTLSQNPDPKFQNSKFLQFVSKMSRGELIVEDNQVKPGVTNGWVNEFERHHPVGNSWASEFGEQHPVGNSWASEFGEQHRRRSDAWANEFARTQGAPSTSDDWVNDFSRLQVEDWADDFSEQIKKNPYGNGSHESWLDSYDKFVEEQKAGSGSSKWMYEFTDQNPYVGHPNPLKEGQELFRRGLLSEAVLALEAEVMKNPDSAEAWRLLGITHAENDDDRQAISSMVRARDADPNNLEVLLALGVGHTNELEQAEALRYLRSWLQNHPTYGKIVTQDPDVPINHAAVTAMVNDAALMSPEDGDVHTVLGVLYNLSREYDRAIGSFQRALQLKPRDYALWNKLGATQANSSRSIDAIAAYQQALDLKPNYVRAWSNMGIGYANQGLYEESVRYYVRALGMNPKADNVWDYLRISLSSTAASRSLLAACESRQLDVLQKAYPL